MIGPTGAVMVATKPVYFRKGAAGLAVDTYNLKGVVAIAPIGPGILKFINDAVKGEFIFQGAQPFSSVTVLATRVVNPEIGFGEAGGGPDEASDRRGEEKMRSRPGEPAATGARSVSERRLQFDMVAEFVAAQDGAAVTPKVPVTVIQATEDKTTVTPSMTKAMIKDFCSRGASIGYKEYAGESHGSVIAASMEHVLNSQKLHLPVTRSLTRARILIDHAETMKALRRREPAGRCKAVCSTALAKNLNESAHAVWQRQEARSIISQGRFAFRIIACLHTLFVFPSCRPHYGGDL